MVVTKRAQITIVTLFCVSVAVLVGLWVMGLRLFVIATPSMATTAPVGTFVVTQSGAPVNVGDIIAYAGQSKDYVHRVINITSEGNYITKGDLNGAQDAAPVSPDDVIGTAVLVAPYWGWLFKALPWLAIGGFLVYSLSTLRKYYDKYRWHIRIVGTGLVISIASWIVSPWLHADMLSYMPESKDLAKLHLVNTGVFPLNDEHDNYIFAGQDYWVDVTEKDKEGKFFYVPKAHIGSLGVILLTVWCLWPLALGIFGKFPEEIEAGTEEDVLEKSKKGLKWGVLLLGAMSIVFVLIFSGYAAFTAKVTNTSNTIGARTYFTCAEAEGSNSVPKPVFAYAINNYTGSEPDISGNSKPGTWVGAGISNSTTAPVGCLRDVGKTTSFNGSSSCLVNQTASPAFQTLTLEAWFKTSTVNNGKIIGFGNVASPTLEVTYDRHIYIDKDGRIVFGVYPGTLQTMQTPAGKSYADSSWHHVIVTLNSAGGNLYVDGDLVNTNTVARSAQIYSLNGYWKVGCGKLTNWRNGDGTPHSGPTYFTGQIQYAAVYSTAMTPAQVKEHYLAGAP